MLLTAYAQPAAPGEIQLWVGAFGREQPPLPVFTLDGAPAAPLGAPQWHPIRDRQVGPGGTPVNHQGLFRLAAAGAGRTHRVELACGAARQVLLTRSLPAQVPQALDGSFNVLLTSCYYQPNDGGGLLGSIVSQIQLAPDLAVLAGDQVYLDLPLFEDLPDDEPALSQRLGDKYRRNWASSELGVAGLGPLLARAPVVCLPDDHEYWNNYPFRQKQLPNTWKQASRDRWSDAARALFHDYQVGGPPALPRGALRLDVAPLKMLFVDMRSLRDDRFDRLTGADAEAALVQWADDLLAARAAAEPAVGALCSGQALFIDAPKDESKARTVDAEMGNYRQCAELFAQLERLADAGVPVVWLTGDVHWSRIASARDQRRDRTLLWEVINSPSTLIEVPFVDTAKSVRGFLGGLFGARDPWPRHGDPDKVPAHLGPQRRWLPRQEDARRGDQVAIVSFSAVGQGVEMKVHQYAIHADKRIAKSHTAGPFGLRVA